MDDGKQLWQLPKNNPGTGITGIIMQLFETVNPDHNLLPYEGSAFYFGKILPKEEADTFFRIIREKSDWQQDQAIIFGKHIKTRRKTSWYGDSQFQYTYSGTTKTARPWYKELFELKKIVEDSSGESFNSCLLNLYHDGSDGMGWHSDAEKDLVKNGAIASLSLGAERRFLFKHRNSGTLIETKLEHGSLLLMRGRTQSNWLHRLPPSKKIHLPRINLTFRQIATL